MGKEQKVSIWVHVMLFLIVMSWGFNNIAMKVGFRYLTAQQFNGIRLLLALPFMLYFAYFLPSHVHIAKKDFLGIIGIGCLGMGLFHILYPIGIDQTSTPLGGILNATMSIHVVILSLAFRLERPDWKSIFGILLTIVGLVLITLASHQPEEVKQTTLTGIFFVIIAQLGCAINITFLRPYMKRYPPLQVTGLSMTSSVGFFFLVNFSHMRSISFENIEPIGWLCIVYSGLIAYLFANTLWNIAIKNIGRTKVAVYGNLPPAIVIILSAIIFHDVLNALQMVGALIIFTGVVLVQIHKINSSKPIEKKSLLKGY